MNKANDQYGKDVDTLLVSHSRGLLIVGRKKPGEKAEIVNAFEGDEADELFEKLITIKQKER